MKLSPIVVFAYNRPVYLRQTLDALSANEEAKESILFIFCDGPKTTASTDDLRAINEVRSIAKAEKRFKKVDVIESSINNGLSIAIINRVTQIVNEYDSTIVLEDDLVVSPFFLHYMNNALNVHEYSPDVISISGYNYPLQYEKEVPDSYFLKSAECLGWGTWKNKWKLFERDAAVLVAKIEKLQLAREFDYNNQYPFFNMLKNVMTGRVNSWAIRWYASAFVNDMYTLFPKQSLVRHIGNDGENIKADNRDILGWDICMQPVDYIEMHPVENRENRERVSKHFRKYNRRRLSIYSLKYAYKRLLLSKLKKWR